MLVCAVKTLKFALLLPEHCLHFVRLNGLKFIFPVFMGHNVWRPDKSLSSGDATLRRKLHAEKYVCEETSVAIVAQLCLFLNTEAGGGAGVDSNNSSSSGDRDKEDVSVAAARLLSKFTEEGQEKLERCVELYVKYHEKCRQTDDSLRSLRYSLLHADQEDLLEDLDDVEENYRKRCDGGLATLQELAVILVYVCCNSSGGEKGISSSIQLVQTKLQYHSLTLQHVLNVLRESIAHINTEELGNEEEEEEEEGVYAEIMRVDEGARRELLVLKRRVLLHYSAHFSKCIAALPHV